LVKVVIRTQVEAADLIRILSTGRQDNDRHSGELPHLLRHSETIHARHHHIQEDKIRGVRLDLLQCRLSIAHPDHLIALELEVAGDQPQDLGIVVGGQDRRFLEGHSAPPK
jgi:hypothetical protein